MGRYKGKDDPNGVQWQQQTLPYTGIPAPTRADMRRSTAPSPEPPQVTHVPSGPSFVPPLNIRVDYRRNGVLVGVQHFEIGFGQSYPDVVEMIHLRVYERAGLRAMMGTGNVFRALSVRWVGGEDVIRNTGELHNALHIMHGNRERGSGHEDYLIAYFEVEGEEGVVKGRGEGVRGGVNGGGKGAGSGSCGGSSMVMANA